MRHRVQTRWSDFDGLGHVNHPVVLTYLEAGRDAFLRRHGISPDQYVVGRCTVSFVAEIDPEADGVNVECEVREIGTKSITTSERISSDAAEVLVEAEFVIVLWDPAARETRAVTDAERESLEASKEGAPA